ncbi:hypothetical protein [Nonomuraea dietziae]|uniref:Uncharacterized protein n=2 Tax=Nonomuraea dietziae TaxID=65515 RepID=A0A7W5UTP6_9ACTN|nr:hypothetical protein [Nonomuraea dietziae]MBB3724362.1 hypothetical protein [Nonomuraea dietziae]
MGTIRSQNHRFLDGRTHDETVGLAPETGGNFTGARWLAHDAGNGDLFIECKGELPGPSRWLDGRTHDASVGLAPEHGGNFTGTRWRPHNVGEGVVHLECLGDLPGPRFLDGHTHPDDGRVGLAPETTGDFTGTRWLVLPAGNIAVRYRGLFCFGETDEHSPDDEPYVIITAIASPSMDTQTVRSRIYTEVDAGDARGDNIEIYRGSPFPLEINTVCMEHDAGDPDKYRGEIESGVRSVAASIAGGVSAIATPLVVRASWRCFRPSRARSPTPSTTRSAQATITWARTSEYSPPEISSHSRWPTGSISRASSTASKPLLSTGTALRTRPTSTSSPYEGTSFGRAAEARPNWWVCVSVAGGEGMGSLLPRWTVRFASHPGRWPQQRVHLLGEGQVLGVEVGLQPLDDLEERPPRSTLGSIALQDLGHELGHSELFGDRGRVGGPTGPAPWGAYGEAFLGERSQSVTHSGGRQPGQAGQVEGAYRFGAERFVGEGRDTAEDTEDGVDAAESAGLPAPPQGASA